MLGVRRMGEGLLLSKHEDTPVTHSVAIANAELPLSRKPEIGRISSVNVATQGSSL